jgi:hypothetical protein
MRRSSFTSGSSRRPPARELLWFFGTACAVFLAANVLAQAAYHRHRYRDTGSEYSLKMANAEHAYATDARITTLFAGDSTMSVGIMPRLLGPSALNIAWSGFEPSEFGLLAQRILAFPQRPDTVYIGLNPTFLSFNEWRDPLSMPLRTVLADGIRAFYADTNSLKPLVLMGGITALSARYLPPPFRGGEGGGEVHETADVEPDGLLVVKPETSRKVERREDDVRITFRRVNFVVLATFRQQLAAHGIRVVWLQLPYSRAFEHALLNGPVARKFTERSSAELARIFGPDLVDLTGTVPDELFRDDVHLSRAGAERLTGVLKDRISARRAALR